jgi:hypothetical protein
VLSTLSSCALAAADTSETIIAATIRTTLCTPQFWQVADDYTMTERLLTMTARPVIQQSCVECHPARNALSTRDAASDELMMQESPICVVAGEIDDRFHA